MSLMISGYIFLRAVQCKETNERVQDIFVAILNPTTTRRSFLYTKLSIYLWRQRWFYYVLVDAFFGRLTPF